MYRKRKETCLKYPSKRLSGSPFRVVRNIIVARYIKGRKKTFRAKNKSHKSRGKKARHIRHKRARAWQCVSCRSACPRWRMRVCRYRETISKTTPWRPAAIRWWRHGKCARANLGTCWSLPTFCSQVAEGAFTHKMPSRIAPETTISRITQWRK